MQSEREKSGSRPGVPTEPRPHAPVQGAGQSGATRPAAQAALRAKLNMREILGVADEPRTRRRWFHDDFFDLFVWQTNGGEIGLFQLCYGVSSSERALVWHKYGGFFHDGVDADVPEIPTVAGRGGPENPFAADPVLARFNEAAQALPEDVRLFVLTRLREYVEKKTPIPARRKRFRRADWQQPPAPRASKSGKSA
jgi:hypothetical protein